MNSENSSAKHPTKDLYHKRIKSFKSLLTNYKTSHFLIENPVDIFYLTGVKLSLGKLLISAKSEYLIVDGRYLEECQEKSPVLTVLLDGQRPYHFLEKEPIETLGFDSSFTSYKTYMSLKETIQFSKPHAHLNPIAAPLDPIRRIKDPSEIALMKKAAQISWKGYKHMVSLIKEGITESQLALEYEFYCKKHGADGLSFEPIIAFGSNSAKPHYRSGDRAYKKNDLVLIDCGIKYQEYCSDMTRVLLPSDPPQWMQNLYDVVLESFHAARSLCKPGIAIKDLDEAARAVMRKHNLEQHFIHSLGHGVGLEVHESPRLSKTGVHKDELLQEGMLITIEPGLYLPGKGGVRYEDTLLITKDGYTDFYPDEV